MPTGCQHTLLVTCSWLPSQLHVRAVSKSCCCGGACLPLCMPASHRLSACQACCRRRASCWSQRQCPPCGGQAPALPTTRLGWTRPRCARTPLTAASTSAHASSSCSSCVRMTCMGNCRASMHRLRCLSSTSMSEAREERLQAAHHTVHGRSCASLQHQCEQDEPRVFGMMSLSLALVYHISVSLCISKGAMLHAPCAGASLHARQEPSCDTCFCLQVLTKGL